MGTKINLTSKNQDDKILKVLSDNKETWKKVLEIANSDNNFGKRILIATSMSDYQHAASLDRVLAIALTARGHKVSFMLCDSQLEACQIIKYGNVPPAILSNHINTPRCEKCSPKIGKLFEPLKLPIHTLNYDKSKEKAFIKNIENMNLSELSALKINNVNIGEHARAGAIRYFASTNLEEEKFAETILRRFLISGYRIILASKNLYDHWQPDIVISHHGIYIPQGVILESFKNFGSKVMTWTPSYRKGTFIFSPNDSYHRTMIDESTNVWNALYLNGKQKKELSKYIQSRKIGNEDWIRFSDTRIESTAKIRKKNYYLALTSVSWDAELHYESRAFPNMKIWLKETIDFFKKHNDLKLIVRVHPAEITSPNKSRESMTEYLSSLDILSYPNITVIGPSEPTSTYDLIDKAKVVLIYNTKTGIEASYLGKPVITAGEAWIKGKGISYDAYSPREYEKYLTWFINPRNMTRSQKRNAVKYAYHFFFNRMIKINLFSENSTNDLLPDRRITWKELIGEEDSNFQEIINAIIENRVPIAKSY